MHLLIVAAGSGRRMGAERNKLLLPLAGRPLLAWTLAAALASRSIAWIGLVGQERDRSDVDAILQSLDLAIPVRWVQGGDSRQASVACGLAALPAEAEHVLIHDGARCLAEAELFDRCSEALLSTGEALIAATPVVDTIKQVDGQQRIVNTPPRAELWAAQTPQGFPVEQLRQAHQHAVEQGWAVTDDAALFERLGWPVRVLEASAANLKITTPLDLELAAALLRRR
ncbi:MAG: 2-C-methyl-D-erythritol 4-phosphate cytidylyltransferase [Synechococcus sp. MED-G71]|nr:MAG: 2-C-methyl-D-erythritol 4-phosphate cytidylyltransferase [Synechococcus sp. MED-G71]